MKFIATLDFIHPTLGSKHFRDKEYELDENFKGNELLERVGYIKRIKPLEKKKLKKKLKQKSLKVRKRLNDKGRSV